MSNDRAITIGGVLFAVLTFVGVMLLIGGVAGGDTTNAEAADWLADSGHRPRALIGAYLMCAGGLAFVAFIAGTVGRLRAAGSPDVLVEIVRLSGFGFVVCQLIAAMAMAGAAYAVSADNEPQPIDPGALRVTTLGLALWLIPGMLSASVFAGSVGAAVLSSRAFPTWIGLTGLLCAAVLLAAITFLPAMLFLLWALCVALIAFVRAQKPMPLSTSANPA